MVPAAVIDVIDEHPIGRVQIHGFVLYFAILFGDGYDALAIGNVGLSLAQALHIAGPTPGPVFSIGFLGAMFGAVLFGAT